MRDAAAWAAKRFPKFPFGESAYLERAAFTSAPTIDQLAPPDAEPPRIPIDGLLEPTAGADDTAKSAAAERDRRAAMLADWKTATGVRKNAPIYRAADVHKPEFYKWRNGTLDRRSETAEMFEEFLKAKQPPPTRRPN